MPTRIASEDNTDSSPMPLQNAPHSLRPMPMPSVHRNLLYVVVAAHLAAHVVVGVSRSGTQGEFHMLALLLAEHSLLYLWAGLGTGRWLPRLAIAFGISVLAWSVPGVL